MPEPLKTGVLTVATTFLIARVTSRGVGIVIAVAIFFVGATRFAAAQENDLRLDKCIQQYTANRDTVDDILRFGLEREALNEIASLYALESRGITLVPCSNYARAVHAFDTSGLRGLLQGEFIVLNPEWLSNQADNRLFRLAIFGHELGHFFNRHFTSRSGEGRDVMEEEADRFAACVVGRSSAGDFEAFQSVLTNVRATLGHPHDIVVYRPEVLEQAFVECAPPPSVCQRPEYGVERWALDEPKIGRSTWRTDGSEAVYCEEYKRQLATEFVAGQLTFTVVHSSTRPTDCRAADCAPDERQYICIVVVRGDPVYRVALCPGTVGAPLPAAVGPR